MNTLQTLSPVYEVWNLLKTSTSQLLILKSLTRLCKWISRSEACVVVSVNLFVVKFLLSHHRWLIVYFQSDKDSHRESRDRDWPSSKENRVPIRPESSNGGWDSIRVKEEPMDPSEPPRDRSRDSRLDSADMQWDRERESRQDPLEMLSKERSRDSRDDPSELPRSRDVRMDSRESRDRNMEAGSLNPEPPSTSSPRGRRVSPPRMRNPSPASGRRDSRLDESMEIDLSLVKNEPEDKGYERQVG